MIRTCKKDARESLRINWIQCVGTVLIISLIGELISYVGDLFQKKEDIEKLKMMTQLLEKKVNIDYKFFIQEYIEVLKSMSKVIILVSIAMFAINSLFYLGKCMMFLKIARNPNHSLGYFEVFKGAKYIFKAMGLQLLTTIYIILWSMLFIIPGIIKIFSYSMAEYILIDDPTIGVNEAITKSRKLMDGRKMELFVLLFSFIGWLILVGILEVLPGIGIYVSILGTAIVSVYIDVSCARYYTYITGTYKIPEDEANCESI